MIPRLDSEDILRFWSKVRIRDIDDCWPWMQALRHRRSPYGAFWIKGKTRPSNRIAYTIANGDIPDSLVVCHSCDNSTCCNPKHLFLGTQQENIQDRDRKNHTACGKRQHLSKLTSTSVLSIREQYNNGISRESLRKEYQVSYSTIDAIVKRRTWKHI